MSITKTKKPTQKKLIADHIKKVGSISGLEALSLYRVMDLPKVMSDLIKQGLGIRKEYKNDNTGVRYIRYYSSV